LFHAIQFPEGFTFGSICSGIEAASVAAAPLGAHAAWLAEVDVAASQVLAYRLGATAPLHPLPGSEKAISRLSWGNKVANYGDMTVLPALVRAGQVPAPPMLCGGTPCQAFSVAGRREGLNDARGQLTLSFVDLADAIDEVRAARGEDPTIVVWENVPGVLSDKSNAFGCFLAALAGEDVPLEPSGPRWTDSGVVLGPQRAVAWRIGNAEYFGLAQRRRRVFVVASAREGFDPAAILLEFDGVRRDSPPSREAGEAVAGTLDARPTGSGFPGTDGAIGGHVVPSNRPRPDGTPGLDPTWWDGSPVSQTLDAVLHKGQTMPEKNRFPAVLQPVEAELYSIMPMNSGKDYKARKVEVTQPLMGAGPVGGNQGGDFIVQVVSVALRGREGGATAELGDDTAYALRAAAGGGSDPYVLAPIPLNPNVLRSGEAVTPSPDAEGRVRLRNPSFGVGQPGDPADTLQAAGPGMVAYAEPIPFDTTQLTSPGNYSSPKAGDTGHPLAAGAHVPAIAFSCKDYGGDATEDVSPTMRAMGHSGSHANAGGQIAVCVTEPVTHTLKAEGFDASEDGTGRGQPITLALNTRQDPITSSSSLPLGAKDNGHGVLATGTMAVRRLMPTECHRLQGFPDDWCAVPVGPKGKIAADGPQYKQLGNSWAVNHARWVMVRIATWLAAQELLVTEDLSPANDNLAAAMLFALAA
jgi:DNA (cytosine-5)-methyltransferase 1